MKKKLYSTQKIAEILKAQKILLVTILLVLFAHESGFSQTSVEQFETESNGSSSFTDNGVIFNIISNVNTYDIQGSYPGTGWSGTAIDNRYIDNSGSGNQSTGTSFSIKTTSNFFKVNRFWVYASASNLALNVSGTLTVAGKMSGVTKFIQTKTTGFNTSMSTSNGFTLIDLTNLNGQNYSNIVIDELQITGGGNYQYLCLDAFTWVKDAGTLPVTLVDFNASLTKTGILKADWKTASEKNNSHFILQSSVDGKTWKDIGRKDANPNASNGASYYFETNIGVVSLASFGIFGILLLPFSNKRTRYRYLAIFAFVAVLFASCAKENNDLISMSSPTFNTSTNGNIYLRLAQFDFDGTTTYSNVLVVKAK